jgi:hypothetical protein
MFPEPIAKLVNSVTPVKTGVQNVLKRLDAGFRRHDVEDILQLAPLTNPWQSIGGWKNG